MPMTLREMTPADVEAGLRLCRLSHWNQVARDWEQFLRLCPGGATVAVDDDGRVIGSVATVRYLTSNSEVGVQNAGQGEHPHQGGFRPPPSIGHPSTGIRPVPGPGDPSPGIPPIPGTRHPIPVPQTVAWLAMILVDPAHRGAGIGTCLLERGLSQAADAMAVGLDATPLGQPLYEKLGFHAGATFTRMQRDALAGPVSPEDAPLRVRLARPADREAIAALDAHATGLDRRVMLDWLQEGAPELAWVSEGADAIGGAILGRHGHLASHLGPLLASSAAHAAALVGAALAAQDDSPVFLDIADDRPGWRDSVEALGFRAQRPFTRMYRGHWQPVADHSQLYAIIGPEFS